MAKTKGIHLGWIVVKNLDDAIKFYTEVVGLKLREYHKEYSWAELVGESGAALGLTAQEDEMKAGSNAVLTITVDNIEEAVQKFKLNGVKLNGDIMEIPGHVKLQSFNDKEGNRFQLVQVLHA